MTCFVALCGRTVERAAVRPSFRTFGRLRDRAGRCSWNRPESAGFSRLVHVRRFAWFFVIGLLAVAGLWAAVLKFSAPLPAAPGAAPPHPIDVAVGEDSESPHAVDYQRLDERLQRLSEDPAMVGLAVGVVED